MDPTTIVTAAIAGLSGVTGGFLAVRQQAATAREQLRAEREKESDKRRVTQVDGGLRRTTTF
jgi:hypothetical protein